MKTILTELAINVYICDHLNWALKVWNQAQLAL